MPRKSAQQSEQPEEQQSEEQPQSAEAQSEQDTGQQQSDGDAEQQVEEATQQVDEAVQSETDQGYRGVRIDSTPNEHYTVEGVTSGKPVPEAEADPVAARREATNPDA
jgi:uncharacterized FlaG/YvyC family protein